MTSDKSRNSLASFDRLTDQAIALQTILFDGCTIKQAAEHLECSTRHAKRLLEFLERKGVAITDDHEPGARTPTTYKAVRKSRLYNR